LAIAAFNKEINSLTDKNEVLRELTEDDPDYVTTTKEAINGRTIFDIKKYESTKVRIVQQGFREQFDRDQTFTGHVVSHISVRIAITSHKPGRTIAVIDVSTRLDCDL
jgi:hypothetical protein